MDSEHHEGPRHCGACDEYLGAHKHQPDDGARAQATFNNTLNFNATPAAPAPDPDRIVYGVRADGTWGPKRGQAPVKPAVEAFISSSSTESD